MGDRIKLKIISLPEEKMYNDRKFRQFYATDPQGVTHQYSAWDETLFPKLIKDAEIDAEFITKDTGRTNQSGEKLINYRVVNIYVDGKPILQQPQRGRIVRDDPDVKRRSIALAYSKDLVVAGKIELQYLLPKAKEFDTWLQGK